MSVYTDSIQTRTLGKINIAHPLSGTFTNILDIPFLQYYALNSIIVVTHDETLHHLLSPVLIDYAIETPAPESNTLLPSICTGRYNATATYYGNVLYEPNVTADHLLRIRISGTATTLATEAIDLTPSTFYNMKLSCVGSTIKSQRDTIIISATNTQIASGQFGVALRATSTRTGFSIYGAKPIATFTELPKASFITDVDLPSNLVEITDTLDIPQHLKQDAKAYDVLKQTYGSDDNLQLLQEQGVIQRIPQHQIDTLAVTYGSYEVSKTNLRFIKGSNPYNPNSELQVYEHCKSKGKVYKANNYDDVVSIYTQIKQNTDIIAGKHDLAYQLLGNEEYELLANADFYDGFTQGVYKWDGDQETLEQTVLVLKSKLEKVNIASNEKESHIAKLEKVIKK